MPTHQPSQLLSPLLDMPKQEAARQLKIICQELKSSGVNPVSSFLIDPDAPDSAKVVDCYFERIMGSEVAFEKPDIVENCQWALASGQTPNEFKSLVKSYDCAVRCGAVWEASSVAYRCRTCAHNPCMSLCVNCFKNGNHEGHDFNRFWSQAGGACDCGDVTVMLEQGFCLRHGKNAELNGPVPPADLVSVAEFMLPKLLTRLLLKLRQSSCLENDDIISSIIENSSVLGVAAIVKKRADVIGSCIKLIELLQECADMGGPMRNMIATTLLDEEIYQKMTYTSTDGIDVQLHLLDSKSISAFESALMSLRSICTADDAVELSCPSLNEPPKFENVLSEVMFWVVRLLYPQPLVTFVLSLLPHDGYKIAFAEIFFAHYSMTARLLTSKDANDDNMANRVIHISVQILSSEALSQHLVDRLQIIRVFVACVRAMIRNCLIKSSLGDEAGTHWVVNCDLQLMQGHFYWSVISDLHNILGHTSIARQFLRDKLALDVWSQFLVSLQGMNVNIRRVTGEHVPFESKSYYWAYTAELEAASMVMWNLVGACTDDSCADCIAAVVFKLVSCLESWFQAVDLCNDDSIVKLHELELTFHIPLHRYLAAFLVQAHKLDITVPLPHHQLLQLIVLHPLRIQVGRAEISSNMWVRNGHGLRYQSCLYVQNHFCSAFIDIDLFLLQLCSANVLPDWMILTIFEYFHLSPWLCQDFDQEQQFESVLFRSEWNMPMLEGALRLVASLVTVNVNIDMSVMELTRLEIATLLVVNDRTHSQIKESVPARISSQETLHDQFLETVLEEIGEYKEPKFDSGGNTSQGIYSPKACVWLQYFDPLFTHIRSMQMKEFSQAMNRYQEFVKRSGYWKSETAVWPPFPLSIINGLKKRNSLLQSKTLHAILYMILYRCMKDQSSVSEQALYLTIYLLHLAVIRSDHRKEIINKQEDETQTTVTNVEIGSALDALNSLYTENNVITNMAKQIGLSFDSENKQSLISLLIKIHKRYHDNDKEEWQPLPPKSTVRVGDGCFYIGQLLRSSYDCDSQCAKEIDRVLGHFGRVKKECETDSAEDEMAKKEARKRAIRERQQRLMAQFTNKQKQIMDKLLKQEGKDAVEVKDEVERMDTDDKIEQMNVEDENEQYQCVICNVASAPDKDSPIGLIINCIPTVLGKALPEGIETTDLMEHDGSPTEMKTRSWYYSRNTTLISKQFDSMACSRSSLDCWKGTVKVRTCGHYIHTSCHESYLKTLVTDINQLPYMTIRVTDEEFLCPLCRHLSNAVLPLNPQIEAPIQRNAPQNFNAAVTAVSHCLEERYGRFPSILCPLNRKMGKFFDTCMFWSLKDSNEHNLMNNSAEENRDHFMISLLRANLELDRMIVSEPDRTVPREKLAIDMLVSALTSRLLSSSIVVLASLRDWDLLSGLENLSVTVSRTDRNYNKIPLLLRDITGAMLRLDLILLSSPNFTKQRKIALLTAVYQMCVNARLTRACVDVFLRAPEQLRCHWQTHTINNSELLKDSLSVFYRIVCRLSMWGMDHKDTSSMSIVQPLNLDETTSDDDLKEYLEKMCLSMTQIQAMLMHHLELKTIEDFSILENFNLCHKHLARDLTESDDLQWPFSKSFHLLSGWIDDLATVMAEAPFLASVLTMPSHWEIPKLIQLPFNFDTLFERFLKVNCNRCQKIPKEPVMCLVCAQLICAKGDCCYRRGKPEIEYHALDCGFGTALYLSVTTTMVYVFSAGRAAIWGSVYLDRYGEEDRDLKRGKPLYLSERRLNALEEQWQTQNFDNAKLRWVLAQQLQHLLDGHHLL